MTWQSRTSGIYFGPPERPIFGTLRVPHEQWSGCRVLLCPPVGFEGLFASTTLSFVASHLAEHIGACTLCLDYDGSGDSSGTDRDQRRVRAWIDSILSAIAWLDTNAPSNSPVAVVGLRAGALLAAKACAEYGRETALGLWVPPVSGRAFVRDQRAFNALTAAQPEAGLNKASRTFEANGYFFSDETITDLSELSLAKIATAPSPNVLLMSRSDLPPSEAIPANWRAMSTCRIVETPVADYVGLMQPPWLWDAPSESLTAILDWTRQFAYGSRLPLGPQPLAPLAEVSDGVLETSVRIGSSGLSAILTSPASGRSSELAILVTATFGYRIGPNRINVELARQLALRGISSLRIDVRGVGNNRDLDSSPPPTPYDASITDDVIDAINWARAEGYARLALHGICAGAFHAWRAAVLSRAPLRLVLANIEVFWPIDYGRADHSRYLAPAERLLARLRSEKRLLPLLRLAAEAGRKIADRAIEYAMGSLPTFLHPSGLPAVIYTLARNGTSAHFIFNGGDDGIGRYRRLTGLNRLLHEAHGVTVMEVIDGPDHSFTSCRSREQLIDAVVADLLRWSKAC